MLLHLAAMYCHDAMPFHRNGVSNYISRTLYCIKWLKTMQLGLLQRKLFILYLRVVSQVTASTSNEIRPYYETFPEYCSQSPIFCNRFLARQIGRVYRCLRLQSGRDIGKKGSHLFHGFIIGACSSSPPAGVLMATMQLWRDNRRKRDSLIMRGFRVIISTLGTRQRARRNRSPLGIYLFS